LSAALDEVAVEPTAADPGADVRNGDVLTPPANTAQDVERAADSATGNGAGEVAEGVEPGERPAVSNAEPRRRWRRRPHQDPKQLAPAASANAAVPANSSPRPEESIEALDSEPGVDHRRWRRAPAGTGTTSAHDATVSEGPDGNGKHRRWRRATTPEDAGLAVLAAGAAAGSDETTSGEPMPAVENEATELVASTAAAGDAAPGEPMPTVENEATELVASTAAAGDAAPGEPMPAVPDKATELVASTAVESPSQLSDGVLLDEDLFWARKEPLPAVAASTALASAPSSQPDGVAGRARRRRLLLVAAALAVIVAIVATLLATVFSGGGSQERAQSPASPPAAVRLEFDSATTPDGLEMQRVWRLRGTRGTNFVGRLSFSNPTASTITASHTEVIPKSLASSVTDIDFQPRPTVVQPDPIVRYFLTVPPHETVYARYEIQVAADGADRSRLDAWAQEMQTDLSALAEATTTTVPRSTTTTTTTTTRPPTTPTRRPAPSAEPPVATTSPEPPPPPPTSPPTTSPPALPALGTIVIRTISYGGTGTFGFSGPDGGNLSLTTSGSPDGSAESTAMTVAAGTYAWTQVSVSEGWRLFGIDCTDRDAGPFDQRSTVSGATATFNVQAGETVVCTWGNRPL
jgi:hypothetical protein